jgi:S-DNA-T family DNA segregation ATPase FtsK/SpoIIIE
VTTKEVQDEGAFHRPPRRWPEPVAEEQVVIAAPPHMLARARETLLYVLFPVVGSLGIFGFALAYHNTIFLYLAAAMVSVTVLFAFGLRWAQRRQGRQSARRQRRRYRAYLDRVEERLDGMARGQRASADRLLPDPRRLLAAASRRENLWERRPGDPDFLKVRVGTGPVPHVGRPRVDLGHDPMAEYEQELVDEAEDVADHWERLEAHPVAVPPSRTRAQARGMLCQLAAFRAPGDLRIAIAPVDDEAEAEQGARAWNWVKWLPHARLVPADHAPNVPRATIAGSHGALAALLDELVAPRLEERRMLDAANAGEHAAISAPDLVLLVDGLAPGDPRRRLPLLREALQRGAELRIAVICLVGREEDEPAEARVRIRLPARGAGTLIEAGQAGAVLEDLEPDALSPGRAEALARALAPIRLREDAAGSGLAQDSSLLDLLGIGAPEAIDTAAEWGHRPRALALRTPIGVSAQGELLELDLKQAAEGGMGPHGLIIGATGSGKSELLRTLVAGLALAHSPEELAFAFVDFKGGAAFAELEGLPHTSGLITNLTRDLRLVDRMRDALQGEQERRQSLLRDAGNLDDVVQYRARRASDHRLPPLPDLLVVIDEFGELLASRPEFLDLFVAIGRVGRSLGIHLLFSSQRFDEGRLRGLESHLRYRICLRTNTPLESKGVLGTTDAHLLPPEPGLGFLKVDTAIYERFRAALVAAPGSDAGPKGPGGAAPAVAVFGTTGAPASGADADTGGRGTGQVAEDGTAAAAPALRVVVERLAAGAGPVHRIWLPPLPALLALDAVDRRPKRRAGVAPRGRLAAAVGIVDLPLEQHQEPLTIDLSGATGHLAIVGAPQSGKSFALRTLALALARAHTPEELSLYAIDLGGGALRTLAGLPHAGAVASKHDRDLVRQIVGHLRRTIAEREVAFAERGIDGIADPRAREEGFPDVVLLLDGWAQLRRDFEDLDFEVEAVVAAGLPFGVHVVVTASRWPEMRSSLSDNLGARLELRLNEPRESEIDRPAASALAEAGTAGRCLVPGGHEAQLALPRTDGVASADGLGAATEAAAAAIAAGWDGVRAEPVRALPSQVRRDDVDDRGGDREGLLIGVAEGRLEPVRLDLFGAEPHALVLGDSGAGRSGLLRGVALELAADAPGARIHVIDPRRTLADLRALPSLAAYASTTAAAGELASRLAQAAGERLPTELGGLLLDGAQEPGQDPGTGPPGPPLVLLVDDADLLLAAGGSPLLPLADVLAHGRDAGLHVVLARRVAGTTRALFEPFTQRLMELGPPTAILSGDPSEGPLAHGVRARPQPPGRGLLVRRGAAPVLVQTVLRPAPETLQAAPHSRFRANPRVTARRPTTP